VLAQKRYAFDASKIRLVYKNIYIYLFPLCVSLSLFLCYHEQPHSNIRSLNSQRKIYSHKTVFPESSFDDLDRGASGTKLKMISRSNENSEASTLLKWMDKGVFDALKSRYLKTMAFCIFEGSGDRDASRLLERYMFKITYPESGGYGFDNVSVHTESNDGASQTSVMSPKALQAKAVHMIRGLISLCSTFEALPEERTISMFLFYHDNVTPRDYEHECFSCVPDGASYISGCVPLYFCLFIFSLSLCYTHTHTHIHTYTPQPQQKRIRGQCIVTSSWNTQLKISLYVDESKSKR